MTKVQDAINNFDKVSWKYAKFGASDTEPRAEFTLLLEGMLADGKLPRIPENAHEWQLFSDMKGSERAARALGEAAARVAAEALADPQALRAAFKYRYGHDA